MQNYDEVQPSDNPIEFVQGPNCRGMWDAQCAYCDTSASMVSEKQAEIEIRRHARERHWSWTQRLYVNDKVRESEREHRQRYRDIMGDAETTAQMNREGL